MAAINIPTSHEQTHKLRESRISNLTTHLLVTLIFTLIMLSMNLETIFLTFWLPNFLNKLVVDVDTVEFSVLTETHYNRLKYAEINLF